MIFLDDEWFEKHIEKGKSEFNKPNRSNLDLVEVYENCWGGSSTIWIYYELKDGMLNKYEKGEGEDNIPDAQFRCFGEYKDYVRVCKGELDPNKGIISGTFTLEGNLLKAMGMLGTYGRLTEAKRIPGMEY